MKQLIFAGISVFSAAVLWGQSQPADRAKINLEEEEVTLMDAGKVTSTRYVSIRGAEKESILKEVQEKIFKKFGIQKEAELSGKNLHEKYNDEKSKTIIVKRLEHPRLRFLDAKGALKKELTLGDEVAVTTNTDSSGKTTQFKTEISRAGKVAKDQQYALYTERYANSDTYPGYTGKVKYFDVNGNVIFEKQYPKFRIGGGVVSDDGSKIYLTESWTENWAALPKYEPYRQFVAYTKAGTMLFSFPKTREEEKNLSNQRRYCCFSRWRICFSRSGKAKKAHLNIL